MAKRTAALRQYREIVDRSVTPAAALSTPREGWLCTVRKALGMSGADLAARLGLTRARISQAEAAERAGGITLKSMQAAAKAMNCRFVYAIVPDDTLDAIIGAQARRKADAIVRRASGHMALENQALSSRSIASEIERLAAELARTMPSDFWRDP